ncbi:Two-component response regulator, SAPR family, consists of REC, wHTH and BTAD domains [Paenibacillus tianmuensis]|uniref:Two-component response regulator, SAPR family, consists of REC, wHTH and BTAD domains n=1 Tax=Paenibacillus tianmuensis TaxID=624147 RepID=A0A1G4T750_9BACL|nr:response regulator [Paenibacillus tianmuensis]SCW77294.1 Two-component response regulator, SAPR family, consists of REC, wHTH and BTAD domains [Paenibacillus tianmuensis]
MIRMILADDEALALFSLQKQLDKLNGGVIAGAYQNAEEAVEAVLREKPEAVFLDIDMPELSGLEAAEIIMSHLPETEIIFVTAYEEYALKAFELAAIDYLLKPVSTQRLAKTLARLSQAKAAKTGSDAPAGQTSRTKEQVTIRCFQTLEVDTGDSGPVHWRTNKAQELFAYLVHLRDQPVRKDALLELFWPDIDPKKGYTQLYTTIYQIRKTASAVHPGIRIVSGDKGYRLELNGVDVDVVTWEERLQTAPPLSEPTLARHLQLLELYRGDYLEDCGYWWAENERERLRMLWYRHAMRVAAFLETRDNAAEAFQLYYLIQRRFPFTEEVYWALIKLFMYIGDRVSVERQYDMLSQMLYEEFGTKPARTLEQWCQERVV